MNQPPLDRPLVIPTDRPVRIGIMGGGQLAQMITESATKFEFPIEIVATVETGGEVIAENAGATVARLPKGLREGMHRLLRQLDLVTFENEFVDCAFLEASARATKVIFEPPLAALRIFQDKLRQKVILTQLGIPTSPWVEWIIEECDVHEWLARAFSVLGDELVLKWGRLGYDGKGVHFVSRGQNLAATETFAQEAFERAVPLYAEKRVRFKRELAIAATLSTRGEFAIYPLVVSEQKEGICHRVTGPAAALGVPASIEMQARTFAEKIARTTELSGTFAIEFFETEDGSLCVNEIAPRVHNSAHFTQEAAKTSQFENHLRGILGLPLGETSCAPAFAMINLLGPDGVRRYDGQEPPRQEFPPGLSLHWYGKREIQPRRKLGHINAVGSSIQEIALLCEQLEKSSEEWVSSFQTQATPPGDAMDENEGHS